MPHTSDCEYGLRVVALHLVGDAFSDRRRAPLKNSPGLPFAAVFNGPLAQYAGVSEATVSRAMSGHGVRGNSALKLEVIS